MEATTSVGFLAQTALNKRRSLDLSLLHQPQSQSEEVLARVTEKAKDLQLQALGVLDRQTEEMILKDRKIALLESQLAGKDAVHVSEVEALQKQNSALQEKLEEKGAELQRVKEAAVKAESAYLDLKGVHEEFQMIAEEEKLKLQDLTKKWAMQERSLRKTQEILEKTELALAKSNIEKQAAQKQVSKLKEKCEKAESFQIFVLKEGYLKLPSKQAYTAERVLENINLGLKLRQEAPMSMAKQKDAKLVQSLCKGLNKTRLRMTLEKHGFSGGVYSKYL